LYLWMKWLHIVSVISWMAGILYLYRLLIYHRERGVTSAEIHDLLRLMEYRLYRYITVPAMVIAAVAGGSMIALSPGLMDGGWLWLKLVFVLGLIASTIYAGRIVRFASENPGTLPTSRFLRIANEVPTILMFVIVGLVVFKAF
jgi:putative membrane protein